MSELEEKPFTIKSATELFALVRRYIWVVALITAAAVAGGVFYTYWQVPLYRATATMQLEPLSVAAAPADMSMSLQGLYEQYRETQNAFLKSDGLAEDVVKRLQLEKEEEFQLSGRPAEALKGRLKVELPRASYLVKVSVESRSPQLAARIVNGVLDSYLERKQNDRRQSARAALGWVVDRIDELKAQMLSLESEVEAYKTANGIVTVQAHEPIISKKVAELTSEHLSASVKHVEMQTRKREMEMASDPLTKVMAVVPAGLSPTLAGLRNQELKLASERTMAERKFGPKHPEMQKLDAQLASVRSLIDEEVKKATSAFEIEYRLSAAREAGMRQAVDELKTEALSLGEKSIKWRALQSDLEATREQYRVMLKRLEETRFSEPYEPAMPKIIDRASAPILPIWPRPGRIMLVALLLGLCFGVMAAYVLEALDSTIKGPETAEQVTGLPTLGHILQVKDPQFLQSPSPPLPMPFGESFRSMRSTLLLSTPERPPRALIVTSAQPGEGKTFTAGNLAHAYSQLSGKTLIIDADLRRPRIHAMLGLRNDAGLANVLAQGVDPLELIQKTDKPWNLDVLTSGPTPPNPSELLTSERMGETLRRLTEHYDQVLIDTPPLLVVSDAALLSRFSDGVILLLRVGKTHQRQALRAMGILQAANARVLGTAVNGIRSEGRNGYGYYYYYEYKPTASEPATHAS